MLDTASTCARPGGGRLIVLDALTYTGNSDNLAGLERDPRYRFVQGDICEEEAVRAALEQHEIDTIVHFAAESHVDRSIPGPDEFIRTNVVGTHALLQAAKALWVERKTVPAHRFHHRSTDEVYGSLSPAEPPFHEATPYAPNSPYSASKAGSDHLVRAYHETYGLATTVTNCSNNYGPYQFPEKLIPRVIINLLAGEPLPVYGDGQQIRDWLQVADHCRAIELALTRGVPGADRLRVMSLAALILEILAVHVGSAINHPALRYFSTINDTILLIAAIALTSIVHQYPLVNAWLTVKVLLLALYIVLGTVALRRGRTRWARTIACVLALATFAADLGGSLVEE